MAELTQNEMMANLGEMSAWLTDDAEAADRFAAWYNVASIMVGIPKPVINGCDVQAAALQMFNQAARFLAAQS